jgi:uncharacterized membrane protein (Fun14 family)
MDSLKSSLVGAAASIVGTGFIGLLQDVGTAFLLGAFGALGGWAINKLVKLIESKYGSNKKV